MSLDCRYNAEEAEISEAKHESFELGLREAIRISLERGRKEGVEIDVNDVIPYIKKTDVLDDWELSITINTIKEIAKRYENV